MQADEPIDLAALDRSLANLRKHLLSVQREDGLWEGQLAASALATATALFALYSTDPRRHRAEVESAQTWLARNQNADGGWGDTPLSPSNLSATLLAWAALSLPDRPPAAPSALPAAEKWLIGAAGGTDPECLARAVYRRYGNDRTFAVPILTMAAMTGKLGPSAEGWRRIDPLPFEFAVLPHALFRWLNLSVVSYALPALMALGLARFKASPPRSPWCRLVRTLAAGRIRTLLPRLQPESGGFLEAVPLTSFVVMGLVAAGMPDHIVVPRGVDFLLRTHRHDGSWPIDTDLAGWLTALAIPPLAARKDTPGTPQPDWTKLTDRLLALQVRTVHPFTAAAPGGWTWTDRSGGVPDADDTAGALLALHALRSEDPHIPAAVRAGMRWLLQLQNRDGGIPTFCRGWQRLPFDRSSPDLTAHAVRAVHAWLPALPSELRAPCLRFLHRAMAYLHRTQHTDGTWISLWFGNPGTPDETNPVHGTSRVLLTLASLARRPIPDLVVPKADRGIEWLLQAQNENGGWGGGWQTSSTVEETALAVEALACWPGPHTAPAIARGTRWLLETTREGTVMTPAAPIGLYFARLWYGEALYPWIFALAALQAVRQASPGLPAHPHHPPNAPDLLRRCPRPAALPLFPLVGSHAGLHDARPGNRPLHPSRGMTLTPGRIVP